MRPNILCILVTPPGNSNKLDVGREFHSGPASDKQNFADIPQMSSFVSQD